MRGGTEGAYVDSAYVLREVVGEGQFPRDHPVDFCQAFDATFRGKGYPMVLGHRIELTGMRAEVRALAEDGRPSEARFRFDRPLDDTSLRWLQWARTRRA